MSLGKQDVVRYLKEGAYDFGPHAKERVEETINTSPYKILQKMAYWGRFERGRTGRGPVWIITLPGHPEYRAVIAPHSFRLNRAFVVTMFSAKERIPLVSNFRKFRDREIVYDGFAA